MPAAFVSARCELLQLSLTCEYWPRRLRARSDEACPYPRRMSACLSSSSGLSLAYMVAGLSSCCDYWKMTELCYE